MVGSKSQSLSPAIGVNQVHPDLNVSPDIRRMNHWNYDWWEMRLIGRVERLLSGGIPVILSSGLLLFDQNKMATDVPSRRSVMALQLSHRVEL